MKKSTGNFPRIILFSFLFAFFFIAVHWGVSAQSMETQLYFEPPVPITSRDCYFPSVVKSGNKNFLFFEEVKAGKIYIEFVETESVFFEETEKREIAGPFDFSGEVPDIYSVASDESGTIAAAVSRNSTEIIVLASKDGGKNFSQTVLSMGKEHIAAPRIFNSKRRKFTLFLSSGDENSFSIAYSVSDDGIKWSELSIFAPSVSLDSSFSPYLCPVDNGDIVVFQSHFSAPGRPRTFQLYSVFSPDGFKTFSPAVLITDDSTTPGKSLNSFIEYSNQSPVMAFKDGEVWCAWERTYLRNDSTSIVLSRLSPDGRMEEGLRVREFSGQKSSHRPSFFFFSSSLCLSWFDGTGAYMSYRDSSGAFGTEKAIRNSSGALFVCPLVASMNENSERLSFIWQRNEIHPQIYIERPDISANPPKLSALNFREGKRSSQKNVRLSIQIPADTSGIAGYSWSFSRNRNEEPSIAPENVKVERDMTADRSFPVSVTAHDEGEYFFKAKVLDFAGNWSDSAEIIYYMDFTPPKSPEILPFAKDSSGFVKDSSIVLEWRCNDADSDVEGYSWSLVKVLDIESGFSSSPHKPIGKSRAQAADYVKRIESMETSLLRKAKSPPSVAMQKELSAVFDNCRNGVYVFSVCAVDEAGNAGKSSAVLFVANKYVPHTVVSGIRTKKSVLGSVEITVYGQDFLYEGFIDRIFIDKDGQPPYDRTLYLDDGEYKINSSSMISEIHLDNLDAGTYGIYIHHTARGTEPKVSSLNTNKFTVDESGVVKIEHPYTLSSSWTSSLFRKGGGVKVIDALVMLLFVLCVFVALSALRGVSLAAKKSLLAQSEALSMVKGESMPLTLSRKNEAEKKSERQTSLKLKMAGFTVLLVLAVVSMASVPLGIRMIRMQRRTLVEGMKEQIVVLLEGMANSVQNAMNDAVESGSSLALIDLVHQADSFAPALYASLIGSSADASDPHLDYYWASTLPSSSVAQSLDSSIPDAGKSRFVSGSDEFVIAENCAALESQAHILVDRMLGELEKKYSKEKKDEYMAVLRGFSRSHTSSIPVFDEETLGQKGMDYTFYYPVFYKNSDDNRLLHSVIVLKVSTGELLESLRESRFSIVVIALGVTVLAAVLGAIGSWILASFIVDPIKKLARHVKVITQTKDKRKLDGFSIKIRTRDEIQTLGDSVNEMTEGLVKAAEEEEKTAAQEKLALDGKSVQQTFLPLLDSNDGGKKTTAELKEKNIRLFGYYEGADSVSGDYFDYRNLDGRFYAVIKCDASGHGVPAALIMTVVATLFRKYFENWSLKTHGISLNKLVVQINDFIESLGVKGKFAALLVCLFDTQTGDVHICNAGDSIVHLFDQGTKTWRTIALHSSPAAGALPSSLVEQKGGFCIDRLRLNLGDILFLYTDGIEEASRFFRNPALEVIKCSVSFQGDGEIHFNHKRGDSSEQMGNERIKDIVEAVLNRRPYILKKYHSPVPDEELVFDFSVLEGTPDEAIMALASVEKIFRMYKTTGGEDGLLHRSIETAASDGDAVCVDRKIDDFLKRTFNRYDYYCNNIIDLKDPNYVYYAGVEEDPQTDDLTLLAIQKL